MNGLVTGAVCLFRMAFDYALCCMNCNASKNMSLSVCCIYCMHIMFADHRGASLTGCPVNLCDKLDVRGNFNVWNLQWMTDVALQSAIH